MSIVYDPSRDDVRRDPFPLYERLQREDPVHWSPVLRSWIVTRYDDVRRVANVPEMSPDRLTPFYESLKDERRDLLSEVIRYLRLWLVFRDPPEHTRLRRLLSGVFNARAIQSMQPRIDAVVAQVLDALDPSSEVDLVSEVAMLVPGYVILEMLGIERGRFAEIKHWSDDMRTFIGTARGEAGKYERVRRGAHEMAGFFRELIARRRAEPRDDFVSAMIAARDEDDALTEDELVATCMLVLFGGHETTTNLISNAVNALLDHPDQFARLREDATLTDKAIEEFLRFDGPTNSIARVVAAEHELRGKTLRRGERVFAMINAANRDPAQFDRAQALDLGRDPNRHLAFGFGIHFCLGASLARMEGRSCIGEIVRRYPRLRRGAAETDWIDALIMRGLTRLPVRL